MFIYFHIPHLAGEWVSPCSAGGEMGDLEGYGMNSSPQKDGIVSTTKPFERPSQQLLKLNRKLSSTAASEPPHTPIERTTPLPSKP